MYFDFSFNLIATGGMNEKLTGDFPDLMQTSKCLVYNPTGDPTDTLEVAEPCPNSVGICKRRIGKILLISSSLLLAKNFYNHLNINISITKQ